MKVEKKVTIIMTEEEKGFLEDLYHVIDNDGLRPTREL